MLSSTGRVYEQRRQPPGALPGPSTCVYPTTKEADTLAALLRARRLSAVSIGAGEGYLERMLEDRGIAVTAVDLDVCAPSRYASMRCYCEEIRRIRPDTLYAIPQPEETSLLFIWGRVIPWREYLERYPSVPLVVIAGDPAPAGDEGVTDPSASALEGVVPWRLVSRSPICAVHQSAMLAVYERTRSSPSSMCHVYKE